MKLSEVKLEASVISSLYQQTLVEPKIPVPLSKIIVDKPAVTDLPKQVKKIDFLGDNNKDILLLVNYPEVKYLPDDALTFLLSMLSACKLSLHDVAIVNIDKITGHSYRELNGKLPSTCVWHFDIAPSALELPIDFPQFQVQAYNNSRFLYTPSLIEIKNDKGLKSKLWVCLQKFFNL